MDRFQFQKQLAFNLPPFSACICICNVLRTSVSSPHLLRMSSGAGGSLFQDGCVQVSGGRRLGGGGTGGQGHVRAAWGPHRAPQAHALGATLHHGGAL